jgi:hypothetical protein
MMLDAARPFLVEAERAGVAQRFGAAVEPDVVAGLDAAKVFESDAKPQGRRHVVIGDTDPLAADIGEAANA